jgi:TonB family protein
MRTVLYFLRGSVRQFMLVLFCLSLSGRVSAQATAQIAPGDQKAEVKSTAVPVAVEAFRQPGFPGGPSELAKFLSKNLQYPAEASESRISGRVMVSFWVDEQGHAYGFGAVQSPHPALEAEALRVARKIERWEPGLQEGLPATMQMYLPVTFKLMER